MNNRDLASLVNEAIEKQLGRLTAVNTQLMIENSLLKSDNATLAARVAELQNQLNSPPTEPEPAA